MILPQITNKQLEILYQLYRFRFLDRTQIQQLLLHKDYGRVNKWLSDLLKKKYLKIVNDTNSKIIHDPFIYRLSSRSIHLLETHPECKPAYLRKIYKEGQRSESFRKQCMFIANIYLYLQEKYGNNSSFVFYTPSEYSPDGIIKEISPHFVYRKEDKGSYYIAEFFKEKAPELAVKARINKYIEFATESDWTKNELPPNMLFICPSASREENIHDLTHELLQEHNSPAAMFTTTVQDVQTKGIDEPIWKQVK